MGDTGTADKMGDTGTADKIGPVNKMTEIAPCWVTNVLRCCAVLKNPHNKQSAPTHSRHSSKIESTSWTGTVPNDIGQTPVTALGRCDLRNGVINKTMTVSIRLKVNSIPPHMHTARSKTKIYQDSRVEQAIG